MGPCLANRVHAEQLEFLSFPRSPQSVVTNAPVRCHDAVENFAIATNLVSCDELHREDTGELPGSIIL